jgi:curved DNA-binding protein CbpA
MARKHFANIKTLEELKKEYRRLAFQHHPDRGGNAEIMKEINAEYEYLFNHIQEFTEAKTGEKQTETSSDFMNIINNIIHCEGIEIEICGNWIWISGNTYQHKSILKENGFSWGANKKQWYWKPADYVKKSRKSMSMDQIRETYGSQKVETKRTYTLA